MPSILFVLSSSLILLFSHNLANGKNAVVAFQKKATCWQKMRPPPNIQGVDLKIDTYRERCLLSLKF